MLFQVYVLYSQNYRKYYTGFTTDLAGRLLSHNEKGHGWTVRYRPWSVIYIRSFETKKEAIDYEKWLKSGVGREFIKTITKPENA